MICKDCLHGYYQPLREMILGPKTQAEIEAAGERRRWAGFDFRVRCDEAESALDQEVLNMLRPIRERVNK